MMAEAPDDAASASTASSASSASATAFAGGLAGFCEAVAVQPLEMVKTRCQLNRGANVGVVGEVAKLMCEGGVKRFYRGLLPELSGMSLLLVSTLTCKVYKNDGMT